MVSVWPMVVVESDPAADACLGLRPDFPGVEVDAFVFQRPPEALNEDVVQIPGFAVHRYFGLGPLQPVGPVERRELRPLVRIHDLGRAEAVDCLVQRLDAKISLQRVGDAPGQNFAGEPVHDGHQIEEAFAHGQVGDVGAPDLIWPLDPQTAQQIGVGLVSLRRAAGVGFLVDRQ